MLSGRTERTSLIHLIATRWGIESRLGSGARSLYFSALRIYKYLCWKTTGEFAATMEAARGSRDTHYITLCLSRTDDVANLTVG